MFIGKLKPYQEDAVARMVAKKQMLVAYEMGLGKEQPISEPVLTPTGWVPIGSLTSGDFVIGKNGVPTEVLGVFPQGIKDVYKISFSDESNTRCGLDHVWTVITNKDFTTGKSRNMTLKEILESGVKDSLNQRKFRIPMVEPVQFSPIKLPLDAYLLGSLLGDGYLPYRSVMFSTADYDYVNELESRLPEGTKIAHASKYDYAITGIQHQVNPVLNALRELGLSGSNSRTKFIPEIYKRASIAERIELLAGLLDTDGHFAPNGNIEYTSASLQLITDLQEIVRSLGGTCKIREKHVPNYGVYYRSNIKVPPYITPTILARKKEAYKPKTKYPPTRLIDSIEFVGKEESICIKVAAEDQLYVTKDYIVTHNTPMTIAAIEQLRETGEIIENDNFVLVLCLASLKYQWQKEIQKFTDKTALVIDGSVSQRHKLYAEAHDYDYVIMNYEQVVNDWDILNKLPISAMVCDEATAIKGFRAKRAKKVKELSKKVSVKFALTGTPVENGKPEEVYSIMQFVNPKVLGRFDLFDKTFIVRNHFGGVQYYRNLPILHEAIKDVSVRKSQKDDDVKPYLPDAVYREPLLVKLDSASQKVYNYIANDLQALLLDARESFGTNFSLAAHYGQAYDPNDPANQLRGEIMSRISALRMLCSSPNVIKQSYDNFEAQTGKGSAYIYSLGELLDGLHKTAKLDAAISYLTDHLEIDDTYKAVVFTSYLDSVSELVARLKAKGYDAVAYTGEMNAAKKEEAKVNFQTSKNIRVLVSSDAGGYGVDLPQANLLLNYDQPWSSGLAVQRNGRINRASSTWSTITIQDILVQDSIEQRQWDMLKQKSNIAGAILDGTNINLKGGVDLTVGNLLEFISTKVKKEGKNG
jgi:superfamily II DNA or RNA helicase